MVFWVGCVVCVVVVVKKYIGVDCEYIAAPVVVDIGAVPNEQSIMEFQDAPLFVEPTILNTRGKAYAKLKGAAVK